jgi:hypothetical protein
MRDYLNYGANDLVDLALFWRKSRSANCPLNDCSNLLPMYQITCTFVAGEYKSLTRCFESQQDWFSQWFGLPEPLEKVRRGNVS